MNKSLEEDNNLDKDKISYRTFYRFAMLLPVILPIALIIFIVIISLVVSNLNELVSSILTFISFVAIFSFILSMPSYLLYYILSLIVIKKSKSKNQFLIYLLITPFIFSVFMYISGLFMFGESENDYFSGKTLTTIMFSIAYIALVEIIYFFMRKRISIN